MPEPEGNPALRYHREPVALAGALILISGMLISALIVVGKLGPRLWAHWQDLEPRVTALAPATATPIEAQAATDAALADLSAPALGGGRLTVLGNPAAQHYPDCSQSVARTPWDLVAFDGGLYIGLGNASNRGPSPNAGPVPVIRYDPADNRFRQEVTLPEEQLDRFYQHDGQLWVPGADARQSWRWGSLYRRDAEGGWTQHRSLPRTVHAYALAWHASKLFAGVSITEAVPEGVGSERYGSAVAVSTDAGAHWSLIPLGGWRIFDFLRVDDQLFATDVFPGPGLQRWLDAEQRQHWHAPVYELAAAASGDRPRFRRRLDLDAATLFPDTPQAGQRAAVVERALAWGKTAAYLGVFAAWQDRWPARGAYLAERLREGDVRVHRIPLPARALAFDLRLEGDALQLLFAEPEDDGRWRNSLWSSRDGRHWEALLSFSASGPARAVERLGDHLYFGLGSPRPPEASVCTRTDALSGTLIRWRTL